jgi:hypothetical protein
MAEGNKTLGGGGREEGGGEEAALSVVVVVLMSWQMWLCAFVITQPPILVDDPLTEEIWQAFMAQWFVVCLLWLCSPEVRVQTFVAL